MNSPAPIIHDPEDRGTEEHSDFDFDMDHWADNEYDKYLDFPAGELGGGLC